MKNMTVKITTIIKFDSIIVNLILQCPCFVKWNSVIYFQIHLFHNCFIVRSTHLPIKLNITDENDKNYYKNCFIFWEKCILYFIKGIRKVLVSVLTLIFNIFQCSLLSHKNFIKTTLKSILGFRNISIDYVYVFLNIGNKFNFYYFLKNNSF